MNIQHQNLAQGGWQKLTLVEQLANIGSEVERSIKWKNKGNQDYSKQAFERSLELFDLTLVDGKNGKRLSEIARARELWTDYFFGGNSYHSSDILWQKYFYPFNYAARIGK